MATAKRIAVTGAAGQIGYSLLPRIAAGEIFGADTPVILQCLEIPAAEKALEGVRMELQDCAFPLLQDVVCSSDPKVAFKGVDLAILVGAKPRGAGMERKDLIRDNGPIFIDQGKALEAVASKDVRVVVVGNPCNTNCLIALSHASGIPKERFTAMTQLDHNRAKAQLALKAGVPWRDVKNVAIWGNHSNTQFPDISHATVAGRKAKDVVGDATWLEKTFIPTIQERGKHIIQARGKSSAASAANAALDHCRLLFQGTARDEWTSMAVPTDGSPYGVPEGIVCSFPVRCPGDGTVQVIEGLAMDDFARSRLQISVDELLGERETVQDLLA